MSFSGASGVPLQRMPASAESRNAWLSDDWPPCFVRISLTTLMRSPSPRVVNSPQVRSGDNGSVVIATWPGVVRAQPVSRQSIASAIAAARLTPGPGVGRCPRTRRTACGSSVSDPFGGVRQEGVVLGGRADGDAHPIGAIGAHQNTCVGGLLDEVRGVLGTQRQPDEVGLRVGQ